MKDVKILTTSHWKGQVTDNVAQLSVTDDYQLNGCKNMTVFKLLRNGEQLESADCAVELLPGYQIAKITMPDSGSAKLNSSYALRLELDSFTSILTFLDQIIINQYNDIQCDQQALKEKALELCGSYIKQLPSAEVYNMFMEIDFEEPG